VNELKFNEKKNVLNISGNEEKEINIVEAAAPF